MREGILKRHYRKIGRLGGLSRSPKKIRAAQKNGRKGGRKKKTLGEFIDGITNSNGPNPTESSKDNNSLS